MNDHRESLRTIAARAPLAAWGPDTTDLPWGDPEFSERMLREHLSQDHELASRRLDTIARQTERLVEWMGLAPGGAVLDITCGPGLVAREFAQRGFSVTGVDIAPAAIRHAIELTAGMPCNFFQADVREVQLPLGGFDGAIYLYGQAGVATPADQLAILMKIRRSLCGGAPLVLEVRDASRVDRRADTHWWSGAGSLFGMEAHLVLTERGWDAEARATVERDIVLDIETGELTAFGVTERAFEPDEIAEILRGAGFPTAEFHEGWDGLDFDGAQDWLVVVAR